MICQICKKNNATTHLKATMDNTVKELMICNDCAKKMGGSNLLNNFSFNIGNLLNDIFEPNKNNSFKHSFIKCEQCGLTFEEISSDGKVGCAKCYETFRNELMPSIERIHGKTTHVGKVPNTIKNNILQKSNSNLTLNKLKKDLSESIKTQDFENAAILRDKIKELERQDKEDA